MYEFDTGIKEHWVPTDSPGVEDHGATFSLVAYQTVFGGGVHWDDRLGKGYKQFVGHRVFWVLKNFPVLLLPENPITGC